MGILKDQIKGQLNEIKDDNQKELNKIKDELMKSMDNKAVESRDKNKDF